MRYAKRLAELQARLGTKKVSVCLITRPTSVRYFCGFSGTEGSLLVSRRAVKFFTDFRYQEQAAAVLEGLPVELVIFKNKREAYEKELGSLRIKRLGVEEEHISFALSKSLEQMGFELVGVQGVVDGIRAVKDSNEIKAIKRALGIAERAFRETVAELAPGMSELSAAAFLEYRMKSLGAENPSFDTIVASGARSSLPHGVASAKRIGHEQIVLFDFGCKYDGYCSDLTRVVYMCRKDAEMERLRKIVIRAQRAAFEVIRPGVDVRKVDAAARSVIEREGLGEFFGHGLGHGLGLDVHEYPRVSPLGKGKLKQGMVFTVEPGIYLEGRGGVRIEDVVVVTSSGCKLLSRLSRNGEVIPCIRHRTSKRG